MLAPTSVPMMGRADGVKEERWNIDTCCKDASSLKLARLAGYQLVRTIDALLQVCTVLVSRLINHPATHSKLGTYPAIMEKGFSDPMLLTICALAVQQYNAHNTRARSR